MEFRCKLKDPYISVEGSYGGSQTWFSGKHKQMCRCGCGVVAAGDLLLYLSRYHPGCRTEETVGLFNAEGQLIKARYQQYLLGLRRRYFPLIPFFGMPFWTLTAGLNLYFIRNGIPLRASWGMSARKMDGRMREMLQQNIPVILSVGPNFPFSFGKHRVNFYAEQAGRLICAAKTKAHFVTATAADPERICISSWGKVYYLDRKEYEDYVKKHGSSITSNICRIRTR